MVLVNDARTEFYGELIGKRVLVFVLPDIDGLCAWRILKIMYTLLVVNDKHELRDFFTKNKDSSDEESAGESDDDEKKRSNVDVVEKRIEKRRWLRRRQDILMDYESFSFYTVSTSVVLFDLAWRLSQENNCLLWFAIVGETSQLLTNCINREHYVDQIDYLQSHVSRLGHMGSHLSRHSGSAEENKAKVEIMFEEELALWLYKHWSLKETLETSMVTASKFKLFTEGGQKKMQEFLVHVGLSRRECLQRYSTMNSVVRDNLHSLFSQYGEKYGLSRRDIFLPSFTVQLGYKTPISAIDAVFLAMSALGCHGEDDPGENFQRALETLSCWSLPSLESELGRTQAHLQNLASQVRNLIDTDEVVAFGPFLYVYIRKTSLVSPSLRNPLSLSILAKYMLMAKAALRPKLGRDRRIAQMPLILCIDSRADEENIVLMGIPPLHGDDDRNLFGQAFEAGVRRTKAKAQFCYFDNNCIELRREDMLKLFEALAALLS
ncbi:hypothetical protein P879_04602 [Paragonimus westermani]|uniref:Cell division control protein 45 n=1 Tax=Paragonimus westermani TaxID=34504 RepID=A0A8T0D1X1_9TREM|nr:hypothetical protein P879_04602 [Paragonimus westermani]